ncbi:hypothetical protein BH23CHL10_BH23CHL10_00960 [soil metagenome]
MHLIVRFLLAGRTPNVSLGWPFRHSPPGSNAMYLIVLIVVFGTAARLLAASAGHNYDMESYWIVAGHADAGDNVYASTHRYNYAPAWFMVLDVVKDVADRFSDPFLAFRYLIALLLTAVDIAIASMLLRRFGLLAAGVFFANPVSILITGYHSQFDNLAIAVGLAGMLLLERAERQGSDRAWLAGVAVLGVSLVVKHLLLVLPLWIALRQRSVGRAALVLILPVAMLSASFVPFAADGWSGIAGNVIGYRSAENAPFHTWLLPPLLQRHVSPTMLLAGAVLLVGWLVRRRSPVEHVLLYCVTVTVFAPGVYWQYLAIPAAASVVFFNSGYLLYIGIATLFLLASPVNVGIPGLADLLPGFLVRAETGNLPYGYLIALLATGLFITLVENHLLDLRIRRSR